MKTLAVIGTAGRRGDGQLLTMKHWDAMVNATRKVIEIEKITNLVSGGAAWADHAAMQLKDELPLKLYIPQIRSDQNTAMYYHKPFGELLGRNTWQEVLDHPNKIMWGGFKDRNSRVACDADCFIAMTFGNLGRPKDGGTMDTVVKMMNRGVTGYHLDLNTMKLYKAHL